MNHRDMRKILSLVMLFCGAIYMQAQGSEPLYEKEGDMVKATYYHDNGEIAQVGHLLKGKLHGEWIMYSPAGEKIALGQYVEGIKTGKWFFWKKDKLQEVDYVNNEIVNVVSWNNSEPVAINK